MTEKLRAYLLLHLSVFLFGATAILGKLLSNNGMDGFVVVWWRMLFTAAILMAFPGLFGTLRKMPAALRWKLAGIGALVAVHWVFFYVSVALSNPSVTLCCFATTAFLTALIEPFIFRKKVQMSELLLGIFVIPGIWLVMRFSGEEFFWGIVFGLLAALMVAIFSTLNKAVVAEAPPMTITLMELGSGWLFITVLLPLYFWLFPPDKFLPTGYDVSLLLVFCSMCTVLPYYLSLLALRHMSTFTSNLAFNLEPVYGVLMAAAIFHDYEQLHTGFYIGMALILLAVFSHPFIVKTAGKKG